MIQDIITLTIVFSTLGYTLFVAVKSITVKKASNCGGCSGCSMKEHSSPLRNNVLNKEVFNPKNLTVLK